MPQDISLQSSQDGSIMASQKGHVRLETRVTRVLSTPKPEAV